MSRLKHVRFGQELHGRREGSDRFDAIMLSFEHQSDGLSGRTTLTSFINKGIHLFPFVFSPLNRLLYRLDKIFEKGLAWSW